MKKSPKPSAPIVFERRQPISTRLFLGLLALLGLGGGGLFLVTNASGPVGWGILGFGILCSVFTYGAFRARITVYLDSVRARGFFSTKAIAFTEIETISCFRQRHLGAYDLRSKQHQQTDIFTIKSQPPKRTKIGFTMGEYGGDVDAQALLQVISEIVAARMHGILRDAGQVSWTPGTELHHDHIAVLSRRGRHKIARYDDLDVRFADGALHLSGRNSAFQHVIHTAEPNFFPGYELFDTKRTQHLARRAA